MFFIFSAVPLWVILNIQQEQDQALEQAVAKLQRYKRYGRREGQYTGDARKDINTPG
jgi:hypothetical protein